jgi:hypothetical protein
MSKDKYSSSHSLDYALKEYCVDEGPIDIQPMETICKHLSLSAFQELCGNMSLGQLGQVITDLGERIRRIEHQIDDRPDAPQHWIIGAKSALSIMSHKRMIASSRISKIRSGAVTVIADRMGGTEHVTDKRLLMIKCLSNIIDTHCNFSRVNADERAVIQAGREMAEFNQQYNGDISYNPVKQSISLPDGTEIASVTKVGPCPDEYGHMMARSWKMAALLSRMVQVVGQDQCAVDHDPNKCSKCYESRLHDEAIDLLSEVR